MRRYARRAGKVLKRGVVRIANTFGRIKIKSGIIKKIAFKK